MNSLEGISLGEASFEDLPAVLSLQKLAFLTEAELYGDGIQPLRDELGDLEAEMKGGTRFLKAVENGKLVGSVRGRMKEGSCLLGKLMVHPDWRGRGLGTKLMESAEGLFPEAASFKLFTGSRSEGNLRLYRSLGYAEFKRAPAGPGWELVFMEKARK